MMKNFSSLYDTDNKNNTSSIELTFVDYSCVQNNCIYISGVSKVDGKIVYNQIKYGKNLSLVTKKIDIGFAKDKLRKM